MKTLGELKDELELTPIQTMLLANTGSMTVLLEALFGPVSVQTESQKILDADSETARVLEISEGEAVNRRIVRLVAREQVLVHATSVGPL